MLALTLRKKRRFACSPIKAKPRYMRSCVRPAGIDHRGQPGTTGVKDSAEFNTETSELYTLSLAANSRTRPLCELCHTYLYRLSWLPEMARVEIRSRGRAQEGERLS